PVKAITIKAALELAKRLSHQRREERPRINTARDVFELLRGYFLDVRKEQFICLIMDTKGRVARRVVVSEGTLTQSLVHPREAFQEALKDSGASVIFAHNHPSGDPTPSRDDQLITHKLWRAGDLLGIRVLDHVIIGREKWFSFSDEGRLRPD